VPGPHDDPIAVMHVLKQDGRLRNWYLGIKRRRGAKIGRVAVMRRGRIEHLGTPEVVFTVSPAAATICTVSET